MRTSIGYPDHDTTVALLADAANRNRSAAVAPLITSNAVSDMAALAAGVHVDAAVLAYVSRIAEETRRGGDVKLGVSVRGCLAYVRVAKTWAAAHGRTYVTPDDVKELAVPVLSHRVLLTPEAEFAGMTPEAVVGRVLAEIAPPSERAA
jgi:MoxR-like ATPase